MELNVKIHSIGVTQNVSDTFSKREFVVETQEEYKQYLLLQVIKDKCSLLDNYKVGQEVTVSLNFKGRLWQNPEGVEKCFNTLECWRIEKLETTTTDESYKGKKEFSEPLAQGSEPDGMPF